MVDARAKGARTETQIRDILREHTGLQWERIPGSGALDEKHGLKGDLYVAGAHNLFCVEVKGYAEDHINSTILSGKSPQIMEFWSQAVRQGLQVKKEPLLIFKFNRSKAFVAWKAQTALPEGQYPYICINRGEHEFFVSLLDDWLRNEDIKFVS